MDHRATRPDLAALLGFPTRRVLAWTAGAVALAVAVWASPVSPTALSWADASLGDHTPAKAAHRYDAVAWLHPSAHMREEAAWRAAFILGSELGQHADAADRLEDLLARFPQGERAPEAWELLGHMRRHLDAADPQAAVAFNQAFQADKANPRAEERLVLAARAFAEAGDSDRAAAAWTRLEKHFPDRQARARIGLAQLALAAGDTQAALGLYEEAIPHANDPAVRKVAALGAATCLERLGNLDEALAELDSADLPEPVHTAKRARIRTRIDAPTARPSVPVRE